ncbi:MAG: hypothetical protein L6406_13480 [Desulfobacterales bacterium]|nr:hypothetical protein [Desulfobacterales bacterium]
MNNEKCAQAWVGMSIAPIIKTWSQNSRNGSYLVGKKSRTPVVAQALGKNGLK